MRAVILISGRGSNMQALLRAGLTVDFRCVISNRPQAAGLAIAAQRGVATAVVDHEAYPDRDGFDSALAAEIDRHAPDLVILAGFMRVLTDAFVQRYAGRLINVHPALLPAFPGLRTHERALQAGVRLHGCSVHYVTPEVDGGPILVQAAVPVLAGDTPETLASRVLRQEHRILPLAVDWIARGRVYLGADGRVVSRDLSGDPEAALISPADGLAVSQAEASDT